MTPVQSKGSSAGGGTSQTISFNTLPTVGNWIIVKSGARGSSSSAQVASVTDNQGAGVNTYTQVVQSFNTVSGASIYVAKVNVSSGTFTITLTWSGAVNGHALWINEMPASAFSGTVDKTGSGGSTTNATAFNISCSGANANASDFVVAAFSSGNVQSVAIGLSDPPAAPGQSAYTSEGLFDSGAVSAALDAGFRTTGALETSLAEWSSTTGVAWSAVMATFLPTGASQPQPYMPYGLQPVLAQ